VADLFASLQRDGRDCLEKGREEHALLAFEQALSPHLP